LPLSPPLLIPQQPASCASSPAPVGRCWKSLPRALLLLGRHGDAYQTGFQAVVPKEQTDPGKPAKEQTDPGKPAQLFLTLLLKASSSLQCSSLLPLAPGWSSSTCRATHCAKKGTSWNTWVNCCLQLEASSPKRPCPPLLPFNLLELNKEWRVLFRLLSCCPCRHYASTSITTVMYFGKKKGKRLGVSLLPFNAVHPASPYHGESKPQCWGQDLRLELDLNLSLA
jgi:hypothetical protein